MRYAVYVTELRYGCAHVEAETPDEAMEKVHKLYQERSIDFYEEELSDMDPTEE